MKKYLGLFMIVAFLVFMLAPSLVLCKNIEGFAGLKWGSTVKEFVHLPMFNLAKKEGATLVWFWGDEGKNIKYVTPWDKEMDMPFVTSCLNAGSGLYIKGDIKGFFKNGKFYAVAIVTTPAYNFLSKADASKLYKTFYKSYGKHKSQDIRFGGEQYYWEDEFGKITLTFEIARGAYCATIEYEGK